MSPVLKEMHVLRLYLKAAQSSWHKLFCIDPSPGQGTPRSKHTLSCENLQVSIVAIEARIEVS